MLLIDKYIPKNIENVKFNKNIVKLIESLADDDSIPHIIFYGTSGCGKKTFVRLLLQEIYDDSINKLKEMEIKVNGSGNKQVNEIIRRSNYHIVVDPKNNNSDKYIIHDVVKEYATKRTLGIFPKKKPFKTVLINNIDTMSYYAQTSLRRTMEQYNNNCRFLMWCNSLSKVIQPLQSRCICIRIPKPTDVELIRYIMEISVAENIKINYEELKYILKTSYGNIKDVIWALEYKRSNCIMQSNFLNSIDKIESLLFNNPRLDNMMEIRKIVSNLTITNYDPIDVLLELVKYIYTNNKISDHDKTKILKEFSDCDYNLSNGRRYIIHFDKLFIFILKTVYESKNMKNHKN